MQSASTLLALAGIFAAFTLGKRSSTKTRKESTTILPGQSKGYNIKDCKLTIYDKQKALDHAFKLGADNTLPDYNGGNNWKVNDLKNILFGDCLNTKNNVKILMVTKEQALFIFDMLKFLYSGIASKSISFEKEFTNNMQEIKDTFKNSLGYDVSDFETELIKK
jgi:hypothetical protein